MRITNNMVANNILLSLNRSKYAYSIYETQLATGKKIQKPSDDPIVAVRALKFRTSVREVEQYKSNAKDAISWMTVTENSISNIIEIVKKARDLSVQASNDPLGIGERESIITSLKQLKDQLANEGNVDYAGRHVFTGYKTDQPLTFTEAVSGKNYKIKEKFNSDDVETIEKIIDDTPNPRVINVDRIRLGYSNIKDGVTTNIGSLNVVTMDSNTTNAYEPAEGTVNFLKDTGELIFNSKDKADGDISGSIEFEYNKDEFEKNDINPIHYFECTDYNNVDYKNQRDNISYQVSYNQSVPINSLGKDLVTVDLMRDLEEMINEVGKVSKDGSKYDDLLKDSLGDKFNQLIGKIDKHKNGLLKQEADLGTRINRMDLTINRLEDDKVNFTDLMSQNEDIDVAEVIMKMKSQEMVYNAALMSSTKIIQTTLLDFIR
ncbi:flagellar hook-associated protein FlgL [Vallitalea guaymasensis]|uniref:Flagellar hook-associated protein FlgL n=1 Tax=Vallitalea guaymasensis TaxID=1185412 RepID=A0A8J8MA90_9FIRM|nr:flagellar hook-associated protein FlgL [Vallitalea guaymasensis]QUH28985.1 flagellar hook-associated protein FlgL [Vallitalea guaymasensis]